VQIEQEMARGEAKPSALVKTKKRGGGGKRLEEVLASPAESLLTRNKDKDSRARTVTAPVTA
jgi:hypothetical protein